MLLEVGKVACCHKATRAQHSPHDLGKVYQGVDGYMQAGDLGRRVGRTDDKVPGLDSTDIQVACSPLAREDGLGAVVDQGAEAAEWTA